MSVDSSGDEARLRLELIEQRHDARKRLRRGILTVAAVPLMVVGAAAVAVLTGLSAFGVGALAFAGTYGLYSGLSGIKKIGSAVADERKVVAQLAGLRAQLPEARVVIRH